MSQPALMSDLADQDYHLPPRRETFLARYPRDIKMIITVIVLALVVLPPAFLHGHLHQQAQTHQTAGDEAEIASMPMMNQRVTVDPNAPALNDQDDRGVKLLAAPDSRVTRDTAQGSLPRISEDGLQPWQLYARPFNGADKRPRLAIILTGLGESRAITDQAISQLPPTVTLVFDSQSPVVGAWVSRARQDGHEVILQIPMEPFDYPRSDPGPATLLTSLPNSDNIERLNKSMQRASGFIGITSVNGSRFVTDPTKLQPIIAALHERGLMVLDSRAAPHSVMGDVGHSLNMPVATVTQRLDNDLSPDAIAQALENLEKAARQNGRAIGIAAPTPLMISQLQAWTKGLPQRGIALAPVSAMVQ